MSVNLTFEEGGIKYTFQTYYSSQLKSIEISNGIKQGDVRVILDNMFYAHRVYTTNKTEKTIVPGMTRFWTEQEVDWNLVSLLNRKTSSDKDKLEREKIVSFFKEELLSRI